MNRSAQYEHQIWTLNIIFMSLLNILCYKIALLVDRIVSFYWDCFAKKYLYFPINYHSSGSLCEWVLLFWAAKSNYVTSTQVLSERELLLWEWKMSQHFGSHNSLLTTLLSSSPCSFVTRCAAGQCWCLSREPAINNLSFVNWKRCCPWVWVREYGGNKI